MPEQASAISQSQHRRREHPMVRDVTKSIANRVPWKICKKIANATGAPSNFALAIVSQVAWVVVGSMTH